MSDTSITVGASNTLNVKLQDGVKLDEVVVQGYGRTATKAKTIGATQTVSAKTVANRPNVNVLQSLQGQLAGTNIALGSGQPGTNKIDVIIRGESSLNASTDPLYVVDGIPLTQAFFRNLNPNIDVLNFILSIKLRNVFPLISLSDSIISIKYW